MTVQPAGIFQHFPGAWAAIGEFAAIDERDIGGKLERFAQLVRGQDDGAAFGQGRFQQILQDLDGAIVERGEGSSNNSTDG